jgi:hypothetical protein
VTTDRSDFRSIVTNGTKLGVLIAGAVVLYLLVARFVNAPVLRDALEMVLVLAAGTAAALLPARLVAARNVDGIAAGAALGLWSTVVFAVLDLAILRPFHAYPWTWDAVGGGTTWWYLPMWWILGTYLSWMGGIVTAARSARGDIGLLRLALPAIIGGLVLAVVLRAAGKDVALAAAAGAGFVVTLTATAILSLVRQS